MSTWVKRLLVVLAALIVVAAIFIFFVVPKVAALTIPYRWRNVPIDQNRILVVEYLGRPIDTATGFTDEWLTHEDNGDYRLKIEYNPQSVANSYQLYFDYKVLFFKEEYLLDEK